MSEFADLLEAEYKAKVGQVASCKAAETHTRKLLKAHEDMGTVAADSRRGNPISAIGGGNLPPRVVDALEKVFARYIAALRKGVPTTLEDLDRPLS